MNLAVIAPAYYPTEEPTRLLRESCATHHLPLHLFGCGQPWRGDMHAHFEGALQAIRNLPSIYDLVMFTDSEDAFVMGGAEEIEYKYKAYTCGVLMSAEQGLYPWGLGEVWANSEEARPRTTTRWKFPNGGGWIGRREELQALLINAAETIPANEAQELWVKSYCRGDFKLDDRCAIFQTMSGDTGSNVDWEGHRLYNTNTKTQPVTVHFNGKLGGIRDFYKRAYGR